MKNIINLFLGGLVLWVAWQFFPAVVQIDSFGKLVLATLLLWVITLVIDLVCVLLMGAGVIGMVAGGFPGVAIILVAIVLSLFAEIIAMTILSNNLDGFTIIGFWPKLLLAICFSVFHIEPKRNQ